MVGGAAVSRHCRQLKSNAHLRTLTMADFRYQDGRAVCVGDLIRVARTRRARVESVLAAGAPDALAYDCSDTVGVLLKLDDGDCWLIRWISEDYELIQRSR